MTLHPMRTGLALGALLGLYHLVWAAMVAIGWAKPLVDFIFWIHFLTIPVEVETFDAARAALLVAVTFGVGWVLGAAFAGLWNQLHRKTR